MKTSLSTSVLGALVSLVACSGGGAETPAADEVVITSCADADVFVRGMEKQSARAGIKVTLLEADPAPPQVGEFNQWRVRISSASGEPITDATLVLKSTMPEHDHGTTVPVSVTSLGGGEYEVAKVYPSMSGLWKFEFAVSSPAAGSDSVVFWFCV